MPNVVHVQFIGMDDDKPNLAGPNSVGRGPKPKPAIDQAFNTWVDRSLHEMFDEVAREPIPDELLKLIRDHEEK